MLLFLNIEVGDNSTSWNTEHIAASFLKYGMKQGEVSILEREREKSCQIYTWETRGQVMNVMRKLPLLPLFSSSSKKER